MTKNTDFLNAYDRVRPLVETGDTTAKAYFAGCKSAYMGGRAVYAGSLLHMTVLMLGPSAERDALIKDTQGMYREWAASQRNEESRADA